MNVHDILQNPDVRFLNLNITSFDAHKLAARTVVCDARAGLEALRPALEGHRVNAAYEAEYGAVGSVAIADQEFAPAGLSPNVTLVAPEPVTVALSWTVPASVPPGSASVTVGALASTETVTTAPLKTLPARSVITGRRS